MAYPYSVIKSRSTLAPLQSHLDLFLFERAFEKSKRYQIPVLPSPKRLEAQGGPGFDNAYFFEELAQTKTNPHGSAMGLGWTGI